jgi:hypothetical protein
MARGMGSSGVPARPLATESPPRVIAIYSSKGEERRERKEDERAEAERDDRKSG